MSKPVVVVGGGVIGLCCAYYLRRSGHEVCVIDRNEIKSGTSFGNAGYICPSHFIPLAAPGVIGLGMKWMLSSTSPFYIQPRLNLPLLQWLYHFWRSSNTSLVNKNAPHLLDLLRLSRELTIEFSQQPGAQTGLEQKGCLMMYQTVSAEKHEIQQARVAEKFGLPVQVCSHDQLCEMEPQVNVRARGAVYYPLDAHLDPSAFMSVLQEALQSDGVVFRRNEQVTRFEKWGSRVHKVITSGGDIECSHVILAAGAWLPGLTQLLDMRLLLQAGKGYSITYTAVKSNLQHPAILVDRRVALTPLGSRLRLGGTMEISGIHERVLHKRVDAIQHAVDDYFPELLQHAGDREMPWQGLRPLTPDGMPYIGRMQSWQNVLVAGGHGMLGISLAAATGKLVKEMVNEEQLTIDTHPYRLERFG